MNSNPVALDERIRVALNEIADSVSFDTSEPPRSPRRPRFRTVVALAAVVAIAIGIAAVVVRTQATHTSQRVAVSIPSSSASRPTTLGSLPPKPETIVGTEQTITTTEIPTDLTGVFSDGRDAFHPVAGTVHALSVNGGTAFVIGDVVSLKTAPPSFTFPAACSVYTGTAAIGGQGIGLEDNCVSLAAIENHSKQFVSYMPDFPKPSTDTFLWGHLPPSTAFVTLTFPNQPQQWERPIDGTVAFDVDTGPTYVLGRDPVPVMRAYDASGELLDKSFVP